jgi:DNA repair protein RadC
MAKKYSDKTTQIFAEEDMPKFKIVNKGRRSLTNTELISILLQNGGSLPDSIDLAKRLMESCRHNLTELSRMSYHDMIKSGLTETRAAVMLAVMEISNRRRHEDVPERSKISGSKDVYDLFYGDLADQNYEEFWILLLNRANKVIKKINISNGGVSGTVADPKKIFKMALDLNSTAIILAHNHPSGNMQPSETDIRLTRKLKEGGLILDLPVLDHLIITNNGYYSFADEGMI